MANSAVVLLRCLSGNVLFGGVFCGPANVNCMIAAHGACERNRNVFAMDDWCVGCPAHCRVCDQQTAACQLCADGYVLRDGECTSLPAAACQADHAGICLACGTGAHPVVSSRDLSVDTDCTTAHCLQGPVGVCSLCDVTGGFFLDTTARTCPNTSAAASVSNAGVVACAAGLLLGVCVACPNTVPRFRSLLRVLLHGVRRWVRRRRSWRFRRGLRLCGEPQRRCLRCLDRQFFDGER